MSQKKIQNFMQKRRFFTLNKFTKSIFKKINEQDEFIKVSIYIIGGFSIVLVGYGFGRLIGLVW